MKDEIFINDLEIFAKHGVSKIELCQDQRFIVSISAEYYAQNAMSSDNINDDVDYSDMMNIN
jgi:dihydroneopterin aldolase/2-amino-4-hydroxy-6-hydroxymethyldihydropteridine diphosphokinase